MLRSLQIQSNFKIVQSAKFFSTIATNKSENSHVNIVNDVDYNSALPFESIPGPSTFQLIKAFMPGGKYHNVSLIDFHKKLKADYGNIVKLPSLLGQLEMVLSYDPDDFEKIFRTDGSMPIRRGLQTLEYYRKHVRPDVFQLTGLGVDNGPNWYKVRTTVNPILMKPQIVKLYTPQVNEIALDFIKFIKSKLDSDNFVPNDFHNMINRWSLESIGFIALHRRLNVIDDKLQDENSKKIIKLVRELFEQSYEYEVKPSLWRYIHTPGFKKLLGVYDGLTNLIMEYLKESIEQFEKNPTTNEKEMGVLEKLLRIDKSVAIPMTTDMLMAGVDTTTSAFSGILYCLAKNPDKQEKLRDEVMRILPEKNSPLTTENMKNLPYLRAVVKEGLRLFPPTIGTMRATTQNLVFQGYKIPQDSNVVLCAMALYYDNKYFMDSVKFIPERWLKNPATREAECPHAQPKHNFAYFPFGLGARMCIGKRIAEMEIEVLIMRLLREFKVEWHQPDLKFKSVIVNIPDADLKFKLVPI